ncbi:MAG: hypothetical protein A3G33_07175 [Omnitrophica bacterium RIFCSPLOWO2_12_FULL_44_17]|uniref:Uncharacterized protein n=1 Tax=Candidatus Danuiimicrobium aquiferis TaxID=1801832 RepID=A0A1G1KZC4_9BACT|nr:MAG: hypothetical protein A3B72_07470 [Omnitrophica bacterium RIFCSPHIGHO2_02_FULL_45_28]OGW90388.1 MAG: hypothetical protein A3E74_07210 [Omnitrophica bacterium RIFCSPHIGHO2_12_FULL_44_12]OGW98009.1 MAG: hypothetical protein A3G33_07175 [Omnitrophica bacterium RIFCSPLOWO2_12_FULL_44_17]OGX03546.1 MAG: hypothetical protein A3J12_03055 [Omnitrophica bacterium RIFCSPLOWO2_02_FULL_44_11]
MQCWIRIWAEKDLNDIQKHLLIAGDLMGDCGNCRELGISYKTAKECPKCKTPFKYVTSRRFASNPGERFRIVKHLHAARQDLTWIDYDDFKKLTGQQTARDFFSS